MAETTHVKSIVMDAEGIERSLTRIAHQVLEKNKGAENIAVVGIVTRGDLLASRLATKIEEIEGVQSVDFVINFGFCRQKEHGHQTALRTDLF